MFIPAKKDYREGATSKNSTLVPVPIAGCLLRERLGMVSKLLVPFSHLIHSQFLWIRARKNHFEYSLNFLIIVPFNLERLFFTYYTDYFIPFQCSMTICFSKCYEKILTFSAKNELFWDILPQNAAVMCCIGYFLNVTSLLFIKNC